MFEKVKKMKSYDELKKLLGSKRGQRSKTVMIRDPYARRRVPRGRNVSSALQHQRLMIDRRSCEAEQRRRAARMRMKRERYGAVQRDEEHRMHGEQEKMFDEDMDADLCARARRREKHLAERAAWRREEQQRREALILDNPFEI